MANANAKVEVAVQVAQRWIVVSKTRLRHDARLRNRRFFSLADLKGASLADLKGAIGQVRDELNRRVMRGDGASRADLFATLERPHLQPLPEAAYAFARQILIGVNALGWHRSIMSRWTSPGIPCPSA